MKDYPIVVFYSQEDKCWISDIPDLKYCSAFGDTPEEAVKEVQIAKQGWLESAIANNVSIPKPTHKPVLAAVAS